MSENNLPFPKREPGVRIFNCFVCGREFKDYPAMKEHILKSHEEGREFVRCPLDRCGACVRCVRTHFAKFHPKEPIPKNCQMKSVVWLDRRTMKRVRRPTFREGYFVSAKNGGKSMHYRSGLECQVYEALETFPEVIGYDVEPFSVDYFFNGEKRRYFPDLTVSFNDGRVEVWEIKPMSQTGLDINMEGKWQAADAYCQMRGWEFKVITEQGAAQLRQGRMV